MLRNCVHRYLREALHTLIAPGILAQSALFVAIFYGINVIWERDIGSFKSFSSVQPLAPRWCLARASQLVSGLFRKQSLFTVYHYCSGLS